MFETGGCQRGPGSGAARAPGHKTLLGTRRRAPRGTACPGTVGLPRRGDGRFGVRTGASGPSGLPSCGAPKRRPPGPLRGWGLLRAPEEWLE